MHLLIDNYDSFTFNIVQALGELGVDVRVFRNDAITITEAEALQPTSLIISPGPGRPPDAGLSVALIKHFTRRVPILGVCLGHQCIVEAFGGSITRADRVMHGKVSNVYHDSRTIYDGLSNPFRATRYHSLIAREQAVPAALEIAAYTSAGEIMGVRLKEARLNEAPVEGVQFHPESILMPEGKQLFANFLQMTESGGRQDDPADS
jgi:anthranilate synthase/aminodeoxychorismate synthase-like glutamine amidotransferase